MASCHHYREGEEDLHGWEDGGLNRKQWSIVLNQWIAKERWTVWYTRCSWLKSTDQVLAYNQTQYVLKYSLDFVSGHKMIHWFRTIDYCFRFSFFYLLTYVNFLHFLANDDRMSSKRRNLYTLVFLINSTTKVNLIRRLIYRTRK